MKWAIDRQDQLYNVHLLYSKENVVPPQNSTVVYFFLRRFRLTGAVKLWKILQIDEN